MGNVLSQTQLEAVNSLSGPVQIISCPGSGKTTVIVHRANNLIKNGISGKNILVITFAVEAAKSMKERYTKLFGKNDITFSTMHSICFNILKMEYGITSENIIDEAKQKDYFLKYFKKKNVMNVNAHANTAVAEISNIKNRQVDYRTFKSALKDDMFIRAYEDYQEYKSKNDLMDFDDLLVEVKDLFQSNEEILNDWRQRFRYLMIDEFQDTNSLQADIFYMLAKYHRNICVVGDDDQSIYSFRAAETSIMLNFVKEFPEVKQIYMTTNYRCAKSVVEKSKLLIKNNVERFDKDIKANSKDEGEVTIDTVLSYKEQADTLINHMQQIHEDSGIPYEEMAVLYRTHSENLFIAGELLNRGIPFTSKDLVYEYHNSLPFKCIESYYRLTCGRERKDDLRFIINFPNRYLKADAFSNMKYDRQILMRKAMTLKNKESAANHILDLCADIKTLTDKSPKEFYQYLFKNMKLRESLLDFGEYSRMDLNMLKQSMDILEEESYMFETMNEWMAFANMQRDAVKTVAKDKKGVTLSTMHGAKGLEWNTVFIINVNEGNNPSEMAIITDNLEEERRLFYVAMTRAKERLKMYNLSGIVGRKKSEFLNEIGM